VRNWRQTLGMQRIRAPGDGSGATWCVDEVTRTTSGEWTAAGWAVPSEEGTELLEFFLDARRCEARRTERVDIARLFPRRRGSQEAGIVITAPSGRLVDATAGQPLRLSLSVGSQRRPDLDYFYPGVGGLFPPPENRRRVHGDDSLCAYVLEGFSAFTKIERALRQVCRRRYNSFGTVLDWGVGCGRVARYFEPDRNASARALVGIDIDEMNVSWCRDNMPWMRVEHAGVTPPTSLRESSIDLVMGVSVFTHLREPDMLLWLEELHRISRRGAILALTTHGFVTFARSGGSDDQRESLRREGYLDLGGNLDISGAVAADPGYYRNVFHTEEYVRSVWGQHFDVLAVLPGLVGNHQDLVLLRRP
jgi:SAM-dependent methyltransferase